MKKSVLEAMYKDRMVTNAWMWCTTGFILVYTVTIIKALTGIGINLRALHVISCMLLMVTYGSCVFFRSNVINLQKLLRDGNFRCLLVACSFLSLRRAIIPMFPFFVMGMVGIAEFVVKNKKRFMNSPLLDASIGLSGRRDDMTLFALKVEALSVPLLFLHLFTGGADMFSVVSYASMAWFEYETNPCMKKAVSEIISVIDTMIASSVVPVQIKTRYMHMKQYISQKVSASLSQAPENPKTK